jgi:hypothetical protein
MLTLGCSLVNAPPLEGSLEATGDTVHAVSKDYSSTIENTLFATAGLYVQVAIFRNMNQTFGSKPPTLQSGHRRLQSLAATGKLPAAAAPLPTALRRPAAFAD